MARIHWQLAAVAALGVCVAGELATYAAATLGSSDRAAWDAELPAHIVRDGHAWPASVRVALLGLAVLQTALLAFVGAATERAGRAVAIAAICLSVPLSVAALRAPYLTSNDAYAYIGYAKLATVAQAYAPPATALPPPFGVINEIWKQPLVPAAYGPLDLVLYRAVAGPPATLAAALFAVRCVGLGSLALAAILTFALTRRLALVPLILLNSGLYEQFVVNAHNDLFAVDAILAGVLLGRRSILAGTVAAAAGGLVKINLAPLGPAFVAMRGGPARRAAAYAFGVAFALAISALAGGEPYLAALVQIAREYAPDHASLRGAVGSITHAGLVVFAFATVASTAAGAAAPWSFAWSFSGLAAAVYPGYLIWGLPQALRDVAGARAFLAVLPIPSLTYDFLFPGSGDLTRIVFLAVMAWEAVAAVRRHATGTARRARIPSP